MGDAATAAGEKTHQFVFLLTQKFSMMPFAGAIEPLRLANRIARRPLYAWRLVSETGGPVEASNGTTVGVDGGLEEVPRDATIIVCAGFELARAASRPVLTWLRREARRGVHIGGVCTGAYVLARAGLLDGKRATIHWENHAAFAEEFPEVELSNLLYVDDHGTMTSAGGTSSADMMLHLIAREHGAEMGTLIAETLLHTPVR